MTERGRSALSRSASHLEIGRSAMSFDGSTLSLSIDEIGVPVPLRLRGRIRLYPNGLGANTYPLDGDARHLWRPLAPSARVEVEMTDPDLRWSGHGYFDHNRGSAPIEDDFSRWTWARLKLSGGSAIVYDSTPRRGESVSLALRYGTNGEAIPFDPPPFVSLRPTGWRIGREMRSENAGEAAARTLEDTPFYARSIIRAQLCGEIATGIHESLSLDRFANRVVQSMLPFRMPRRR
ncbi:MAG: hydratase [Pseudorhodoplanes sp.]